MLKTNDLAEEVKSIDSTTNVNQLSISHHSGSETNSNHKQVSAAASVETEARPRKPHKRTVGKKVEFSGESNCPTNQTSSSTASFETTPKRSRSEAPTGNAISDVLYEVHMKLANRSRKMSPRKLQAKQLERQQKAEELRAKIEQGRQEWTRKVRQRQQLARNRFSEGIEKKRMNLHDRLVQAEQRRQAELQNVVDKAQAENLKAEETNFIIRMTKENQQLDLDNKLRDQEERRRAQQLRELEKIKEQEQRREAADKRRRDLNEELQNKIQAQEQKRVQADQRRREQRLAEKNKARAEKVKRDLAKARKQGGNKLSDMLSFVNNKESLWEFIGMESDLEQMGLQLNLADAGDDSLQGTHEKDLLRKIKRDQFELEKLMLKRDHDILSQCLQIDEQGHLKVLFSPMGLLNNKVTQKNNSSDSQGSEERKIEAPVKQTTLKNANSAKPLPASQFSSVETSSFLSPRDKKQSETKNDAQVPRVLITVNQKSESQVSYSDTTQDQDEGVLPRQQSFQSQSTDMKAPYSDEYFQEMLHRQRMKMSMRRNILRKTISEDLVWADYIKNNPSFEVFRCLHNSHYYSYPEGMETRSQASTPERKRESSPLTTILPVDLETPKESNDTPQKGQKVKVAVADKKKKKQASKLPVHTTINLQNQTSGNPKTKRGGAGGLQTLSKNGSCSSLSSLIKHKPQDESESATAAASNLNQQQLDQLGPVVKMTIHGFPFSKNYPNNLAAGANSQNHTCHSVHSNRSDKEEDVQSLTNSFFSSSITSQSSINWNSFLVNQRLQPPKQTFNSVHNYNQSLTKNANLYLFPIREQKLILMYPDKEKDIDFAQARISISIQEVKLQQTSAAEPTSERKRISIPDAESTSERKRISIPDAESVLQPAKRCSIPSEDGNAFQPAATVSRSPVCNPVKSSEGLKKTPTKSARASTNISFEMGTNKEGTPSSSAAKKSLDPGMDDDGEVDHQQSDTMVDLIIEKLLVDQMAYIRIDDSQKSILLEGEDSQTVLRYLEVNSLMFKYCRLCEVSIHRDYSISAEDDDKDVQQAINNHFNCKSHTRKRELLNIKDSEDLAYSMLTFTSQPGDIENELRREKEKVLKRKVKRLKAQIIQLAVSHENASTYPGKELKSSNKNRLQIRCIELEKTVFPTIKNYETVNAILTDVIKVLEKRGVGDLQLMRKLKFMPTLVDICKRISVCPKNELKLLASVIGQVIKIVNTFCSQRENRNYVLQTNRLMPLIDLLAWGLNRQTELFFGIEFMPTLLHILTTHLKHRVPYECQQMKELVVDYLISSSITQKLRAKFLIVKQIQSNENEEQLGQVPFFLLKSITFLEALTANISIDARTRPVYERSTKIGEHVFFVLKNTDLFGVVQMITTLLLTCNETFKASAPQSPLVLPQTILSLAIVSIKVLNNTIRMDCAIVQTLVSDLSEQLYHMLNFILSYAEANIDLNDDVKELLHETLLFIGYFCLLNEGNQTMMYRGENGILQKMCNLPFTYFFDKKLKDILFPTLITASYQNSRALAILDQELDMSVLVKYLDTHIKEELPKIMEQEQEYFSDHTKSMSSFGRPRSPSSSQFSDSAQSVQMDFLTGNNPYLPLVMRFPKNLWKDSVNFYKSND